MKNDGGPAFPDQGQANYTGGLTLRDYFASAALAGGLEQGVEHNMAGEFPPDLPGWWHPPSKIAARAYAIADAMIAARKKVKETK